MTETPRETRGARARRRPRCARRRRNGARTTGWKPAGSRRGGAEGGVEAGNGEDERFRATSRGGARRGGGACLAYAHQRSASRRTRSARGVPAALALRSTARSAAGAEESRGPRPLRLSGGTRSAADAAKPRGRRAACRASRRRAGAHEVPSPVEGRQRGATLQLDGGATDASSAGESGRRQGAVVRWTERAACRSIAAERLVRERQKA